MFFLYHYSFNKTVKAALYDGLRTSIMFHVSLLHTYQPEMTKETEMFRLGFVIAPMIPRLPDNTVVYHIISYEHIKGTTRVVQASKKITEKRLKWYGLVRRMKEEHIVRRMLDVDIPGKRRRGRPNLRLKDACNRDMTKVGLKDDKTTNRAALRNKIISYTSDPR